jgi:hypothetical protein
MKCQNCGGEMEKGTLSDNGNIWLKPGFRAKILKATYLGLANHMFMRGNAQIAEK